MYKTQYDKLNRIRKDWQTEEEVRLGWLFELQTTLGIQIHAERGRSDADFNQVVIEFKNLGLFRGSHKSREFAVAMDELTRYINAKADAEKIDISEYQGIAIDGNSIIFAYIPKKGSNICYGPVMPLSPASVQMVFESLKNSRRRAFTATNLIEDFGHGSSTGSKLMQSLYELLCSHLDEPHTNKVKMLYMEWKSMFGQVADLTSHQSLAIVQNVGFTPSGTAKDELSRILFVIHTFNSLLVKLLAAEIISHFPALSSYSDFAQNAVAASDDELIRRLEIDIEKSEFYTRSNICSFVEEPLFSWYIDAYQMTSDAQTRSRLATTIKSVLIQLAAYRMEDLAHAQTNDVLKRFYQDIVPQTLRKSLGEFYTPDWLVDRALDNVEGPFDQMRFLDPTCGSASFLLAIIKRIRASSKLPADALLTQITKNVWGFDLNPLAVQTARVNYLIAISDLIQAVPGVQIEIPILLADAIYAPSASDSNKDVVDYIIGSDVANLKVTLPSELASSRNRLDEVFTVMENCVESDAPVPSAMQELINRAAITESERVAWEPILSETYQRVLTLHKKQWNGIWFRIIRNYFWSSTTGQFDVIVGNPPWVRWSKLPELYRTRVMPVCKRYDIFSSTPFFGGNELDISGLITYTVADKWLKENGTLVFLLTQTHFQSASSEGFRRFNIDGTNYIKPIRVEDMKSLKPFPDAANKTALFVAKKSESKPEFPVSYIVWDTAGKVSRSLPERATKHDILNRTTRTEQEANPIQGASSPWAITAPGKFSTYQKLIGRCDWVEGRKGVTCDLNGLYIVNVVNKSADGQLVQIETRPEAGRTKIGPPQKFWVESKLLYPVVKGAADIEPCGFKPNHNLYVIVPNSGITAKFLNEADEIIQTENKRLHDYFRTFQAQLQNRSTYKTRFSHAPFYSIYNVGDYTFAPWKVIWPEQPGNRKFSVAVIHTRKSEWIEERVIVPDHKIYFAEFSEPEPAYYLCGLLCSDDVQGLIRSFHVAIQVGNIFKHIRLPEYDKTDQSHRELAETVKEAHKEGDSKKKQAILKLVSKLANNIINHAS